MGKFWRVVVPLAIVIIGALFVLPIGTRRFAESPPKTGPQAEVQQTAAYVGSAKCAPCHGKQVQGWKKTLHSQMLQDVKKAPTKIVSDWSKPGAPTVAKKEEVDLAVGSRWKQRYMVKRGDDYYFLPAEWVVKTSAWRPYSPKKTDNPEAVWTSSDRSLRNTCQHCMTTGTATPTGDFREPSIGCESCHGPGAEHLKSRSKADIINPRRLTYDRELDICGRCHFRGTDKTGTFEDARGFKPGDDLSKFAILGKPEAGKETDAFFADGASKKHHQQYQDFIQSRHYASKTVTCSTCHQSHEARQTIRDNALCGQSGCHDVIARDIKGHATKVAGRPDITLCVTCHMPRRAKSATEKDITSHTFRRNQLDLKTAAAEAYRD